MYTTEVDILLRVIFSLFIVVSIVGNSLVCFVVHRFSSMRTPINYLLVHLAICDMLVGLFLLPRRVIVGLYEHPSGDIGHFLCKFITYGNMGWLTASASTYTLVAVAWERYNAIVYPLKRRFSMRVIRCMLVICWICAVFVTLLETIALQYSPSTGQCDYVWRYPFGLWAQKADSAIWLTAVGILPYVVMAMLYGKIIKVLWCSNSVNDITRQAVNISRKKITKSVVIVTILGFLLWNPNLIYFTIVNFAPKTSSPQNDLESGVSAFYAVSHNLIFLNSAINPFVYALKYSKFRRCIKNVFKRHSRRRKINQLNYIRSLRHAHDNAGRTLDKE